MLAIFGVLEHRPGVTTPLTLGEMKNAMSILRGYEIQCWRNNGISLGIVETKDAHDDRYDTASPIASRCSRYVIVSDARIDNRDEILSRLGFSITAHTTPSDAEIIIESFMRWGENCTTHLIGDWAFAIFDTKTRRMFLSRDINGHRPLFFYNSTGCFAFASSVNSLLQVPGVPREPNLLKLAESVTPLLRIDGDNTNLKGIRFCRPSHNLIIENGKVLSRRYWFPENAPKIRYASDREYVENFLEIYKEAVRCRIQGNGTPGFQLSSGLDSGSVTALASRLWNSGRDKIQTFSSVPMYPVEDLSGIGRYGDEGPYINKLKAHLKNIETHFLRCENTSPIQGVKEVVAFSGQPSAFVNNAFWILEIYKEAKKRGITTLLTGQMGNLTVSHNGFGLLTSLVLQLNFKDLLLEIHAQKKKSARSYAGIVYGDIVKPFYKYLSPQLNGFLINHGSSLNYSNKVSQFNNSIIHPRMGAQLNLHEKLTDFLQQRDIPKEWRLQKLKGRVVRRFIQQDGNLSSNIFGKNLGLDTTDPTADKRLVEYTLGIPLAQYKRDGEKKRLIKKATQGLLPDEIRLNRKRGWQSADIYERFINNSLEFEKEFQLMKNSTFTKNFLNLNRINKDYNILLKKSGNISSVLKVAIIQNLLTAVSISTFFQDF